MVQDLLYVKNKKIIVCWFSMLSPQDFSWGVFVL